jgi:hypothetical protein
LESLKQNSQISQTGEILHYLNLKLPNLLFLGTHLFFNLKQPFQVKE